MEAGIEVGNSTGPAGRVTSNGSAGRVAGLRPIPATASAVHADMDLARSTSARTNAISRPVRWPKGAHSLQSR